MSPNRGSFRVLSVLTWAIIALIWSVLPLVFLARGSDPSPELAAAETAYAEAIGLSKSDPTAARAGFERAAELYAAVPRASAGTPAALHFNHANALVQAGRTGEAIAEYRAALKRAPADERVAHNLAEARARVAGRGAEPPAPGALERAAAFWGVASEPMRWLLAVVLAWTAFGLAAASKESRAAARTIAVGAVLVASTVGLDLIRRATDRAGVFDAPALVRKGNGDGFEPLFVEPLPEGTECRIAETRPGWIRIELADTSTGWVRDDAVIRVP